MQAIQITDGRTSLWQWDTGVSIKVYGCTDVDQMHFVTPAGVISKELVKNECGVPDAALQTAGLLKMYAFDRTENGGVTRCDFMLLVKERPKPADYINPPDEYDNLEELAKRVAPLIPGSGGEPVTPEQIQQAVDNYLDENPVQVEETDPTVPGWAKEKEKPTYTAKEVGAQPKGDYALKSDIPEILVKSVNGKTGDVVLTAQNVGALPADAEIVDTTARDGVEANEKAVKELSQKMVKTINGVEPDENGNIQIESGAGIAVDDTLTESGKAADAKVTGDRFATLSKEKVDKTTLFGGDVVTKKLDAVKDGAYINRDGTVTPNDNFCYGFIDVSDAAGNITVDASAIADSIIISLYRSDFSYIGNEKMWAPAGVYDLPITMSGVAYYAISCKIGDKEKITVSFVNKTGMYEELSNRIDAAIAEVNKKGNSPDLFGGAHTSVLESVTKGAWINDAGILQNNDAFSYGYIDISNAIAPVTVDVSAISDTVIINFADGNKQHISNIKKWAEAGRYEIANIPFNAAYLCISCKVADAEKVFAKFTQSNVYMKLKESAHGCDAAYANAMSRNMKFIKGLHLDCGRKYFSPANIKTLIDRAHAAGLNTFQIYFSDHNGFRFGLDDMELVVEGKTYDLSIALGDGRAPTDGSDKWLTQAEMDEIIAHAQAYGMEVIPAFDMPDHARAIADAFPDITLTNKHGMAFYVAILKKYAAYFASKGCMYYNICGDESSYEDDVYNTFMRLALPEITKFNMTPLFYNDVVCKGGRMNPPMNSGGIVLGWIRRENQTQYSVLDRNGYRMVNASGSQYYWVLGVTTTTDTLVENIRNSNIFYMADGSLMYNIVGAMYHIWCDQADADGADNGENVLAQTQACIAAFGEAVNRAVPGDSLTVVKSPDGSAFRIDVANDGALSATKL